MRKDLDEAMNEIIESLEQGASKASICQRFRCKQETLNARLLKWGYEGSGNKSGKGNPKIGNRRPATDYLTLNGPPISSHKLKINLWRDEIKPKYCEECGWAEISEDGRLPLELDHINNDHWDNRLENLKILCPNCHALKPGNSGSNRGSYAAP